MHPNLKLLSHSSLTLFHRCPRKFQLYKLLKPETIDFGVGSSSSDFDFGTWVGVGIQEYFTSGSRDQAIMKMFLEKDRDPFIDEESYQRNKKTFWHALIALDKFITVRITELSNWEVVRFGDGGVATELGFILNCIEGFTYRGLVDILLKNKKTSELMVLECKTTKFKNLHEANYKNSPQGLGYSLITDTIVERLRAEGQEVSGSSWTVLYPVYKAGSEEWELFEFKKSHAQRANWIRSLIVDIEHILGHGNNSYFPMHGESCFEFFRPCEYFDLCEMSDRYLIGKEENISIQKDTPGKYSFIFDLMEIIQTQVEKIEKEETTPTIVDIDEVL